MGDISILSRIGAVASRLRTELGLAVGSVILNVATYAHTVLAARYLGVEPFGAFTAAMNVLIVMSVVSLGLQTTVARRVSASPDATADISRSAMRLTYRASVALGLTLAVASPLVNEVLRLDSLATAVLIAVAVVPMTIMGGQSGVLQGGRRWGGLAAAYAIGGGTRMVVGTSFLVWQPTLPLAVAGIVAGFCAPVLLGWWLLHDSAWPGSRSSGISTGGLVSEALRGARALLAFLALSNLDVVIARHALASHESGLYAAGIVLTKAVLFLPQIVLVRVFPALSARASRQRALTASVGIIVLLGVSAATAAALLPGVALVFVGGAEFEGARRLLWLFALLGTVEALVQLFLYSVLARAATDPALVVWGALLVLLLLGLQTDTVAQMVLLMIMVNTGLLLVLVAMTSSRWARRPRRPRATR